MQPYYKCGSSVYFFYVVVTNAPISRAKSLVRFGHSNTLIRILKI